MHDPRLTKWAEVLVNYSNTIQPGEWAVINAPVVALPLVRELDRAILRAGGHPMVMLNPGLAEDFFKLANDDQLEFISPAMKLVIEEVDAMFSIWGAENTRTLSNVDPARMAKAQAAQRELFNTQLKRMGDGSLKWIGTLYPTHGQAQEAEMSLREFEEFVFSAMLLNEDDPVAAWQAVAAKQQAKVDWLKDKQQVTIKSANCDVSLSIEGRKFASAAGTENMPDGEIYTSPVEDSANGWVKFTFPAMYHGKAVEGIRLRFEDGKVVEASADKNEDLLLSQLDVDPGARFLGEFAIGTNFGIEKSMGDTLFDEKIGGSFHMALGAGFPELGSQNQSGVHWDLVCDMRQGGEIHVDGELFYKDGDFVV
jgi:aminopeptidase